MKIREDFVSNSSSCSFVVGRTAGGRVEGLRLLAQVLGDDCELSYEVSSEFNVTLTVLRKNAKAVEEFVKERESHGDSRWEGDWDDDSYYALFSKSRPAKKDDDELRKNVYFQTALDIGGNEEILGKVESVEFRCEDSSQVGMMYLALLYRFFERNECCPDPEDTEHDFLNSCFSETARRLATVCVGKQEKKKKTRRKKT